MIDKLVLRIEPPLPFDVARQRVIAAGLRLHPRKLRDRRWHFAVEGGPRGMYLFGNSRHPRYFRTLTTQPGAFSSFASYAAFLSRLLTQDELDQARITRLDLCVDYPIPFSEMRMGVDVARKQVATAYDQKGGTINGIRIGARDGEETIQIYDKQLEAGLAFPLSRVESQLTGQKVPAPHISDLPRLAMLAKSGRLRPFGALRLHKVAFKAESEVRTTAEAIRLGKLQALIEHWGLHSGRRALNGKCRNFVRDFAPLLTLTPRHPHPDEALAASIQAYFATPMEGNE